MQNFNKFLRLPLISICLTLGVMTSSYATTKTLYPNIPKMLNAFNGFHKTGKMPNGIMTTYFASDVVVKINGVVMAKDTMVKIK